MKLASKLFLAGFFISKLVLACVDDLRLYEHSGNSSGGIASEYKNALAARAVFESTEASRFDLVDEAFYPFSPKDAIFRKIADESAKFDADPDYRGNDVIRREWEAYVATLRQPENAKKLKAFIDFGSDYFTTNRKEKMEAERRAIAARVEEGFTNVDSDQEQFQSLMDFFQRTQKSWDPSARNFGLAENDFLALAIYADNFK